MPKAYTNEYFYQKMNELHPDIQIDGYYINQNSRMNCKHICGYKWETSSGSLLRGSGCPNCNHSISLTQEEFEDNVYQLNSNISVIGSYINNHTKVLVECKIDGYQWPALPTNLSQGHGCPVCNNKIIIPGINDVAATRPDLVQYFVDQNKATKYSDGSHTHIDAKCPYCGFIRDIEIKSLATQGFSCYVCSDGISLPNKIASYLLYQLPVQNWKREYKPKWSQGRFYDNYFEYNGKKYILEMDGKFHFCDNKLSKQTLSDSQNIDKLKDSLALNHGIHVIRIECINSSFDYITNRIFQSELADIFDLTMIDMNLWKNTIDNGFIKTVCVFFQDHKFDMTCHEIANHFHISYSTLIRYRKIGKKFGWCSLSAEERKKCFHKLCKNPLSKKVEIFANNHSIGKFDSLNKCAEFLTTILQKKVYSSEISKAIKRNLLYNGYEFQYI